MLATLLAHLVLSTDPAVCLPTPSALKRFGDESVTAFQEARAVDDPKAPKFTGAPADAHLVLRVIWAAAGNKQPLKALRPLMEDSFTWSFGGDADADQAVSEWAKDPKLPQAVRAALSGKCKTTKDSLTCEPKKPGPRLVLEKNEGCWRWSAFVAGD
ncbi:MAG: hypothetical protein JNK82_35080 [Myxococcaceae bacterium]|nr:hypothetical protein [Myxococcaceae bacterium]